MREGERKEGKEGVTWRGREVWGGEHRRARKGKVEEGMREKEEDEAEEELRQACWGIQRQGWRLEGHSSPPGDLLSPASSAVF